MNIIYAFYLLQHVSADLWPSSGRLPNWFLLWTYTTAWWRLYKSSETCYCNCNEYLIFMGRNSSVSIATLYGLDGRGINSRWGRDFPHLSRPALGDDPASYTMCTGSFLGVKTLGHDVDHPTPSSTEVKERVGAIPLHPLLAFSRVTFTFTFIWYS